MLEFTRDSLERNDTDLPKTNKILFGYSHFSTDDKTDELTYITKAILYESTSSKEIGFRLVRYKKSAPPQTSKSYNLTWDEKTAASDKTRNYIWDQTYRIYVYKLELLDWMVEHRDACLKEIQHTINVLLEKNGNIERIKNATVIDLSSNNISDISPLAGLTDLERLYLKNNYISDLSPLAGLTYLWVLNLENNNISDISPLSGLTNLAYLHIENNNISDISPLVGLTDLRRVFIKNNKITNLLLLWRG